MTARFMGELWALLPRLCAVVLALPFSTAELSRVVS